LRLNVLSCSCPVDEDGPRNSGGGDDGEEDDDFDDDYEW
jgi:hypothetical protein